MTEDLVFRTVGAAVELAGARWPQMARFSGELLASGAPTICCDDQGYIQINVSNGCARYVITDRFPGTGVVEPVREWVEARLMTGRLD